MALERRVLRHAPGRNPRPDRSERRRQDHAVQLPLPALQPSSGDILLEGASILTRPPHQHRRDRHRPHLPERRAVSQLSVHGQCPRRQPCAHLSDFICDSLKLAWVRRGEAAVNEKVHEILAYLDLEDVAHTAVVRPAVRHPEARRTRARARRRSEDPAARRARRRPQPRRGRCARRPDPRASATSATSPCCWSSITWAS